MLSRLDNVDIIVSFLAVSVRLDILEIILPTLDS
jgi:hypothetical protein